MKHEFLVSVETPDDVHKNAVGLVMIRALALVQIGGEQLKNVKVTTTAHITAKSELPSWVQSAGKLMREAVESLRVFHAPHHPGVPYALCAGLPIPPVPGGTEEVLERADDYRMNCTQCLAMLGRQVPASSVAAATNAVKVDKDIREALNKLGDTMCAPEPSPRPWRVEDGVIVDRDGHSLVREWVHGANAKLIVEAVNDLYAIEHIRGGVPASALDKARELRELWETMLGSRGAGGASVVTSAEAGLDESMQPIQAAAFEITDTDGSEFSVTVRRKGKPIGEQVPDAEDWEGKRHCGSDSCPGDPHDEGSCECRCPRCGPWNDELERRANAGATICKWCGALHGPSFACKPYIDANAREKERMKETCNYKDGSGVQCIRPRSPKNAHGYNWCEDHEGSLPSDEPPPHWDAEHSDIAREKENAITMAIAKKAAPIAVNLETEITAMHHAHAFCWNVGALVHFRPKRGKVRANIVYVEMSDPEALCEEGETLIAAAEGLRLRLRAIHHNRLAALQKERDALDLKIEAAKRGELLSPDSESDE